MKRTCDACGKEKELSNGKTCEKGHFICSNCKKIDGFLSTSTRTKCPICGKPLK
jgi:endogenous inhibitor of DNA gyrase (YacG/DUF329 family)